MARRSRLVAAAACVAACAIAVPAAASAAPAPSVSPVASPDHGRGHGGGHGGDDPRAATQLFTQNIAPLATIDGVDLTGSAYGSSFTAKPGSTTTFYGLTDRGPNVDGPDGSKIEPLPDFTPAIGEFKLVGSRAVLVKRIPLQAADGTPYNGRVSLSGSTGETIKDLDGSTLTASPYGYDPEGIAAMRDGTFWISDEYGPFITHFSAAGRQLERLSPFDGSLPVELSERDPNKGMEGLTVTPDGRTLVGVMQAALNAPDGPKSKNVSVVRIVTVDLRSRRTAEYLYPLHNTEGADTTVSEIAALSSHEFLVDERDSAMEPGANKKLFKIDLRRATDVGKYSKLAGGSYDDSKGGLLIGGATIEGIVRKANTADAIAALKDVGVTPVSTELFLDVAGLVTAIDPTGGYFGHDKVEGVAVLNGGRQVVLSNDSDFGIDALANDAPPYQLHVKTLPNGQQDTGELLKVDLSKVPARFRG